MAEERLKVETSEFLKKATRILFFTGKGGVGDRYHGITGPDARTGSLGQSPGIFAGNAAAIAYGAAPA